MSLLSLVVILWSVVRSLSSFSTIVVISSSFSTFFSVTSFLTFTSWTYVSVISTSVVSVLSLRFFSFILSRLLISFLFLLSCNFWNLSNSLSGFFLNFRFLNWNLLLNRLLYYNYFWNNRLSRLLNLNLLNWLLFSSNSLRFLLLLLLRLNFANKWC